MDRAIEQRTMPVRPVSSALPMRIVSLSALFVALSVGAITAIVSSPSADVVLTSGAEVTLLYFVLWVGIILGATAMLLPARSGRRQTL
jgi:hypothetical protein